jgi:hypothetical protein
MNLLELTHLPLAALPTGWTTSPVKPEKMTIDEPRKNSNDSRRNCQRKNTNNSREYHGFLGKKEANLPVQRWCQD